MGQPISRYRLSDEPRQFGLSCSDRGLTLAGVPLLRQTETGFQPRPVWEVDRLLGRAYLTGIDVNVVMGGLGSVARFLNDGEMARAMIAAVLLKLPELDWDGAARIAHADDTLAKAGFDPDESRDSHGRWTTDGSFSASLANDHLRAPGRADNPPHLGRLPLLPETDHGDAQLSDTAWYGDYHEEVKQELAEHLRADGLIVRTEVSFRLDGSDKIAKADIVAMAPGDPTTLHIVEVKTGPRSALTDGQEWVYPSYVHGNIVSSPDPKISAFGYSPGQPLPAGGVTIWYEEGPGVPRCISHVPPAIPYKWRPGACTP